MIKAYDNILEIEINAINVDSENQDDFYRYECCFCGEQVILAAKNSVVMTPHFRHLRHNNNTECDLYISQNEFLSTGSRVRKSKKEVFDLFYYNDKKNFMLGMKFDEDSLEWSDMENVEISLYDTYRNKIHKISANRHNFYPGAYTYYPINYIYSKIYIKNSKFGEREIEFVNINQPNFFKIMYDNFEDNFVAKKVRGKEIYSKTSYLLVISRGLTFVEQAKKIKGFNAKHICDFRNEYNELAYDGYIIQFEEINDTEYKLLERWGYRISSPEVLSVIWPPIVRNKDYVSVPNDEVIIYSTYELIPYKYINLSQDEIKCIDANTYVLSLDKQIKINKKNTELQIKKEAILFRNDVVECEKEELQLYKNSGEYKAYLQNRYGTRKLNDGEEVRITKGTVIKKTQNSYTIGEVQFKKEDQFSEDEIISDILKHYKVEIDLDETSIPEDISNVVRKYVEDCIKNKKVNKAILDLINEGKT